MRGDAGSEAGQEEAQRPRAQQQGEREERRQRREDQGVAVAGRPQEGQVPRREAVDQGTDDRPAAGGLASPVVAAR